MKQNNSKMITLVGVIALIITQVILRFIGIDNISALAFDTILSIICVGIIIETIRNRKKGQGAKYNITVAALMTLECLVIGTAVTMFKCYPQQARDNKILLLILCLVGFFSLTIFLIVYRIVYGMKTK